MVHDNDYLSEYAPGPLKPLLGHPAPKEATVSNAPFEQWPIYSGIIQPIFNAKCTECHDADKVEGGLRMDTFEFFGQGQAIWSRMATSANSVAGDAAKSEIIFPGDPGSSGRRIYAAWEKGTPDRAGDRTDQLVDQPRRVPYHDRRSGDARCVRIRSVGRI